MTNLLFLQLEDYLNNRTYHIDEIETIETYVAELYNLIDELYEDIDIITALHLFGDDHAEEI